MFWIIQENLYNEYGYHTLLDTIERMEIPHKIVKVVPFFNMIVSPEFDSNAFKGDMKDVPEVEIEHDGHIMICGSLTLTKIAKRHQWHPGSFHNPYHKTSSYNYFWKENMLNAGSKLFHIHMLEEHHVKEWGSFFVRPNEDTKTFSGMVTTWNEWIDFTTRAGINDSHEVVQVASLKEIYNESRFFVVDKKLVTWSQYKVGNRVVSSVEMVSPEVIKFAQEMVDMWQPARAFVIDIAETPNGPKIVEANCFNSAGFYACDVSKIVQAVEDMKF